MAFVTASELQREERAIVVGLAVSGDYIVVNTWQLKNLIGRCKSSINGCFRSLGYQAFPTQAKSRQCVLDILPSLRTNPGALRQWTARSIHAASSSSPSAGGSPVTIAPERLATQDGSPVQDGQPPWLDRTEGSSEDGDFFLAAAVDQNARRGIDFRWSEEETLP
jgi:hypothetical protein